MLKPATNGTPAFDLSRKPSFLTLGHWYSAKKHTTADAKLAAARGLQSLRWYNCTLTLTFCELVRNREVMRQELRINGRYRNWPQVRFWEVEAHRPGKETPLGQSRNRRTDIR